jgi:hypothetical protein
LTPFGDLVDTTPHPYVSGSDMKNVVWDRRRSWQVLKGGHKVAWSGLDASVKDEKSSLLVQDFLADLGQVLLRISN